MTISRAKSPPFGVGEKLTSAIANAMDVNSTYALDKRAGQTDTLASVVTASGAGRIIGTYALGADANTTYLVSGANGTIDVPPATLTANRIYTLSNTNAVANDRILVLNRASDRVTIHNAAGSVIGVLSETPGVGSPVPSWGEFIHTGTAWVQLRSGRSLQNDFRTSTALTASYTVPSDSLYHDALTLSVLGCIAGDVLDITAFVPITTANVANGCNAQLLVDDGGNTGVGMFVRIPVNTSFTATTFPTSWTVINAGTITVRLQGMSASAGHNILGSAVATDPKASIRVLRYRA